MSGQFARGFASQTREITLEQIPVRGEIPLWLEGNLLRTGPARFEIGDQKYRHWFDGLAMLHSFRFEMGTVSYKNKFLQSKAYRKAEKTGKISYNEFATDPCRSIFKRIATIFGGAEWGENGNVNISKIGKAFVAITELPLPVEFNPETLETVGVVPYNDKLAGQHCTPHPHYDPQNHMGINSITSFGAKSTYNVYCIGDGTTTRKLMCSIPVQEPGYIHSFGITEQYVILVEYPLLVNPLNMLIRNKPFIENFQWKPEKGVRFFVVRKDTGELVQTYQTEAFFAFHHINAFEQDQNIIIDLVTTPDATIIDTLYLDNLRTPQISLPLSNFSRYTLSLADASLTHEIISDETVELPRINYERFNGQPYRFAYFSSRNKQTPDDFFNQLVKIDIESRKSLLWYEENCYPGEPIFVATPDAKAEDDGVILSIVLDGLNESSFLLILDASTFQEIGRAEIPQSIPFSFHGIYSRS